MKINFTEKHTDAGLLIIRAGIGLIFMLIYGITKMTAGPELWVKLGGAMSKFGITFLPVFWGFLAAFSECVVPVFIILGLFFRPAVFMLLFTMFVASIVHLSNLDPWTKIAYPLSMVFLLAGLFLTGPGKLSLDQMLFKKEKL
ncbi:MAG TPA: DoxX family protein [Ignavibacteria bacterium]|nr:DoxX family protein [Ignavibacteria bacterium]